MLIYGRWPLAGGNTARAPYDLWAQETRHGVRLHVQRVFIMEDTGKLLPTYLRFVRGVIDSADLPLNVSRELMQSSLAVEHIRNTAVKRVLKLLKDLAEKEPEKYVKEICEHITREVNIPVSAGLANSSRLAKLARLCHSCKRLGARTTRPYEACRPSSRPSSRGATSGLETSCSCR